MVRPDIAHLEILSGGWIGRRIPLLQPRIRLGRRPDLEAPVDPDVDLQASALHAELRWEGSAWILRDLGSRNGTYRNGLWVGPEGQRLEPGDEIGLGIEGPRLVLRSGALGVAPGSSSTGSRSTGFDAPAFPRAFRLPLGPALGIVGGGVLGAGLLFALLRNPAEGPAPPLSSPPLEWTAEASSGPPPSFGPPSAPSAGPEAGDVPAAPLSPGAAPARPPQAPPPPPGNEPPLSSPSPGEAEGEAERRILRDQRNVGLRQQLAERIDLESIERANRRAVALLYAEHEGGTVATGTAFGVDASGRMVTSRHVVLGERELRAPVRLAVQFSDSPQVFPARLLAASSDWDLALLQVDNVQGGIPVIAGWNLRPDTLPAGTPVASLGFPLGGETPSGSQAEGGRALARPLLSGGILIERRGAALEFEGYGEPGGSGSPLFDRDGRVLAILFGGTREGGRELFFAVPAPVALTLLQSTPSPPR